MYIQTQINTYLYTKIHTEKETYIHICMKNENNSIKIPKYHILLWILLKMLSNVPRGIRTLYT